MPRQATELAPPCHPQETIDDYEKALTRWKLIAAAIAAAALFDYLRRQKR